MQSVAFFYCYAECHAECIYAECHYAECHYAECHYAECRYAKCHYAECHYAECRFAECCSALNTPFQILSTIMGLEKAIYLIK